MFFAKVNLIKQVGPDRMPGSLSWLRGWSEQVSLCGGFGRFCEDAVAGASRGMLDGRRLFDIAIGALLLLAFLPLMILVAAAIWLSSFGRQSVFYRQQRVGLNGKVFTLIKFRSMRADLEAEHTIRASENSSRVTAIGRLIRRYRIDELPQLFQVLCGEMSLIGPRPERPEFVRLYNNQISGYSLRHRVKPGLTGWAQVNYGYGETIEDAGIKLYYDLTYILNGNFMFDLRILWRTAVVVVTGWGAR